MKYKFILFSPWLLKCPDNRDPKRDPNFANHMPYKPSDCRPSDLVGPGALQKGPGVEETGTLNSAIPKRILSTSLA